MTLSASLFLFRKTLPTDQPDLNKLHDKFANAKATNSRFLAFVRQEIPHLFKPGWDQSYQDRVQRVTVGTKSFLEKEVPEETARWFVNEHVGREEFMAMCRNGRVFRNTRRLAVARKAGKARVVTVASVFQYCLTPLASMMYDHLSKKKWLLRGTAKPKSFFGFCRVPGEVFVSGDYESATDNFNLDHSRAILLAVLRTTNLNVGVQSMALASLDAVVESAGRKTRMMSGQLMGDKLSFPLLCLTNYLAFAYSMRSYGPLPPVKINGDDIVFRSTPSMADAWFSVVKDAGLVVSRGKTMVSSSYFSLNSSFFEAKKTVDTLTSPLHSFSPPSSSVCRRFVEVGW